MKLSDQITRRHLFVAFGAAQQTGTLSAVDLSATRDGASVTLRASDGSVAPIAGADASHAGVMTAADKTKLDSVPPVQARDFGALSDVPGVALGAAITHLRTAGYASPGDGGGALYKRVGSQPSHAFKVQSADGSWWEGVPGPAGVSVRQFGATGDGATDDQPAIQEAVDWARSTRGVSPLTETHILHVPEGTYILGAKVALYSGVHLRGEGEKSLFTADAAFADDRLLDPTGDGTNNYCIHWSVQRLGFAGGSPWAIKATAGIVANAEIRDIWLDIGFGVDLGGYAQACLIDGIYSYGAVDQILHLKGNHNEITRIDKEGGSGSSTDPYILIENHASNKSTNITIGTILLEGSGNANKAGLRLDGCRDVTIESFWHETSTSNGHAIEIANCGREVRFLKNPQCPQGLIDITNSAHVTFTFLATDGTSDELASALTFDAASFVHIEQLECRTWADILKLDRYPNLSIGQIISRQMQSTTPTGFVPQVWADDIRGGNLLVNPSFEAGNYGWSFPYGAPDTLEAYVQSEFADGLMGKFQWSGGGNKYVEQGIAIPAELVGRELTFRAMVELTDAGFVFPKMQGAGLGLQTAYSRASAGQGKQIISITGIPQSAGTVYVAVGAFSLSASSILTVDEAVVSHGSRVVLGASRQASLELGGATHVRGSAIPTAGTWKQGDIVWNDAPASGGAVGWVCVAAGSPGTWKTFGNIAA